MINFKDKTGKISFFALLTILIISLIFVAAQNTTENSTEDSQILEDTQPSVSEIVEEESNDTVSVQNETSGDENFPEENLSGESQTGTKNISDEINDSETDLNETERIPDLNIEISHSNKITRGNEIEVNVVVSNSGDLAKDVFVKWILPKGFEIISGDENFGCGNLDSRESCTTSIKTKSTISTSLGVNEIKAEVSYK